MLLACPAPMFSRTFIAGESEPRRIATSRNGLETSNLLGSGRLKAQPAALLQHTSERRLLTAAVTSRRVGSPPPQSTKNISPVRLSKTNKPGIPSLAALAKKKISDDDVVKPSGEVPVGNKRIIFHPSLSSALLKPSTQEAMHSNSLPFSAQRNPTWNEDVSLNTSTQKDGCVKDSEEHAMAEDSECIQLETFQNCMLGSEANAVVHDAMVDRRCEKQQTEQVRRVGSPPPPSKLRSGSASSKSPSRSRPCDKGKWSPILTGAHNSDEDLTIPCQSRVQCEEEALQAGVRRRGRSPAGQGETFWHLRLSCEAVSLRCCPRNSITPGGSSASSKASTPEGCRYPMLRGSTSLPMTSIVGTSRAGRESGHGTPEQRNLTRRDSKRSTPERSWRASHDLRMQTVPSTPRPRKRPDVVSVEETLVQSLSRSGFLVQSPIHWSHDGVTDTDDIDHVRTLFSSQLPDVPLLGVHRIKHDGHSVLYRAVQDTMESKTERILWHGTSAECVRNITLNGFNRNYCGRHGLKLGHGSYFSRSANYSMRFCDKKTSYRYMFLAKVLVGTWTTGDPELKEAPFRDNDGLMRFDSTVDSIEEPHIFCIFRDFQALPLYLLELGSPCS